MASIQAVTGLMGQLAQEKDKQVTNRLTGSENFTYALNAAKKLIDENVAAETDVQQKTVDFMTGKNDNIVDLMVAQEKSNILLQYTLQVRSGVMTAYKEIMNLQI